MSDRWELTPEQTPAFGPIAERFRRAGEHERAVELCREGLAKFPNHLSGRVTLGWALLDLGRYDEARAELERVVKRAPDNLAAIRGLAELHDRAENAVFVPPDAHLAWPPKPDTIEAGGNGWVKDDGSPVDELTARDPILSVSLGDVEIRSDAVSGSETGITAAEAAALEDAVAQLRSLDAPAPEARQEQPADMTAAAPARTTEAAETSDATVEIAPVDIISTSQAAAQAAAAAAEQATATERTSDAAAPSEPEREPEPNAIPAPVVETTPEPLPEPIDLTTPFIAAMADEPPPEPVVELTADVDVDVAAALPSEFELPHEHQELDPVLELTLEAGGDPLLEAAEAVEMSLEAADPVAAIDGAAGSVSDLAVHLDAAVLTAADAVAENFDVTLDPALFDLAEAAASESALPRLDVPQDDVFEIDREASLDVAVLLEPAPAAADFHAPEPATIAPAAADDGGPGRRQTAMHDLQLDAPAVAPAAELPPREFPEVDAAASSPSARELAAERTMRASEDFGSIMEAGRDFSSPHLPAFEIGGPEPPPLPEPLVDLEPAAPLPEPSIAFVEAQPAVEAPPPVPEPALVAAQPVVQPPPPQPPKPTRKKPPPVAGLRRFLRGIEDRKAKLARGSAA